MTNIHCPCSPIFQYIDDEAARPTLIECVRFRGRERRINIPQEIGVKYYKFGLFLLEDDTGGRIQSIAHKHINDSEQINTEVLRQWITGRGKQPVTWKTLAQVLKDIDLSRLAEEIEDAKSHENTQEKNSTDNSVNKDQSGMPTGSSNQSNTRDVLSRCTKNVTHCETLEQFNNNLLATNLLSADDPPDERVQRDTTAEITEGSSQRNIGAIPINYTEIENDSSFEAMQVADIFCRDIQQSKEENRRSNVFYADIEDPPDETGAKIRSIAHKHMNDAEQINMEVLEEWTTGRGKHPVRWKTLTHVLHDIELSTLAREIEAVKCFEGTEENSIPSDYPVQKCPDMPAENSEQKKP